MTKVTARADIAKVLTDIEAAKPKVVGLDCVFDVEGDDIDVYKRQVSVVTIGCGLMQESKDIQHKVDIGAAAHEVVV